MGSGHIPPLVYARQRVRPSLRYIRSHSEDADQHLSYRDEARPMVPTSADREPPHSLRTSAELRQAPDTWQRPGGFGKDSAVIW